jgi:hypothetical protein
MNITLRKNPQLNLEDAAQKRAQVHPVPSIRLLESVDVEITVAPRQALVLRADSLVPES